MKPGKLQRDRLLFEFFHVTWQWPCTLKFKMASFASETHVVIWRVLNAKKCSSFILNDFQKFIISKSVKCPAITVRCLAVVRAGGRKESASGNCPLHEMPNTRSGEKIGWVRSRKQELLTKISKNRSTVTRCSSVRNISNLRMLNYVSTAVVMSVSFDVNIS